MNTENNFKNSYLRVGYERNIEEKYIHRLNYIRDTIKKKSLDWGCPEHILYFFRKLMLTYLGKNGSLQKGQLYTLFLSNKSSWYRVKQEATENITFRIKDGRTMAMTNGIQMKTNNEWKRELQDHLLKNLYPKIDGPATNFCNTWTILFMQT